MAQGSVHIFHTAQNILAVSISACVGHKLHKDAQAVRQGWRGVQAEEDGKIKPLSDV